MTRDSWIAQTGPILISFSIGVKWVSVPIKLIWKGDARHECLLLARSNHRKLRSVLLLNTSLRDG
jgi:hypothetical protein